MSEQPVVLFEELPATGGKKVGVITLNSPKTLNSLSLEMVKLMDNKLIDWERDDDLACVFLQGAGDKAFCAGGDVVSLYEHSAAYGEEIKDDFCQDFFAREYRLDYRIHTFKKPFVVWASGIVMGGGVGLMCGASHRIVTETTYIAMPEVSIGLFPDVGSSWFLNHATGRTGLFLGLTGAPINGADAKFVGLARRFVTNDHKEAVLKQLTEIEWNGDKAYNRSMVSRLLREFEQQSLPQQPEGKVQSHLDWINDVTDGHRLSGIVERIVNYDGDDKWLKKAAANLNNSCPISPYLVQQQMRRCRYMSLKEVFQFELIMAVNCARLGHFKEGVRALLIDKDRNPQWQPHRARDVTEEQVQAHFVAPWGLDEHPLADL